MKIAVLIPARGGSKRIPKKNIKKLLDNPLIYYPINSAKNSSAHEVWVSTENETISFWATLCKANVLKRPTNLSLDNTPTESVMKHFLSNVTCDIIILLEATHPSITAKDIDCALCKFLTSDYDSLATLSKKNLFVWKTKKGLAKPINYDINERPKMQDFKGLLVESGMWITTRKAFEKSNNRLSGKIGYYVLDHPDIDIDDPIDFKIAEVLLNET